MQVIQISKEYERLLPFLYPDYSILGDRDFKYERFIQHKEITSASQRSQLNYEYGDCVFISGRIFDEVWTEEVLVRETLKCAQIRFKSRKRTLKTLAASGPELVDELIWFLYTGDSAEEEDSQVQTLFDAYGSQSFVPSFFRLCAEGSPGPVTAAMQTYVSKILSNVDSPFYKKARARLERDLRPNVVSAIQDYNAIDPYFKREFPDVVSARMFMMLMKSRYI